LEGRLNGIGLTLVDLKLLEATLKLEEYESQLFYPNVKCISKWSKHFDAVICIEEMEPSSPTW